MDKEILVEYLARLLWIAAESGGLVTNGTEIRCETEPAIRKHSSGGEEVTLRLIGSRFIPRPHAERWDEGDRYRLDTDDRRLAVKGAAREMALHALSAVSPRSSEMLAPRDAELVAQDLVALGRVREALDLLVDEAIRAAVSAMGEADVEAIRSATLGDQDGSQVHRLKALLRGMLTARWKQ